MSMVLGFWTAFFIAFSVISWKTILGVLSIGSHNSFATCHAIASHSRSSSVASHTLSAFFAKVFSSFTVLFFSGFIWYNGLKSCAMSTHFQFFGNSTICPSEAFTSKSDHNIFVIVFDLAGDSTITRFFAIFYYNYVN
jgi:hypothetical protein